LTAKLDPVPADTNGCGWEIQLRRPGLDCEGLEQIICDSARAHNYEVRLAQ
jgi:hypothetical protein